MGGGHRASRRACVTRQAIGLCQPDFGTQHGPREGRTAVPVGRQDGPDGQVVLTLSEEPRHSRKLDTASMSACVSTCRIRTGCPRNHRRAGAERNSPAHSRFRCDGQWPNTNQSVESMDSRHGLTTSDPSAFRSNSLALSMAGR